MLSYKFSVTDKRWVLSQWPDSWNVKTNVTKKRDLGDMSDGLHDPPLETNINWNSANCYKVSNQFITGGKLLLNFGVKSKHLFLNFTAEKLNTL